MLKLLCLSNGHGEDEIACRIVAALRQQSTAVELAALPIVGVGYAYRQAGVTIVGPVQAMPSGGFVNQDGRQLVRDVQAGLVQLTLMQLRTIQAWAKQGGVVLAVGDIVPLLLAWLSGSTYAFVGTAKSEYCLQDEDGIVCPNLTWFERLEKLLGGVYLPWERWLMQRSRCKAVFPRDRITTTTLQRYGIAAIDAGNPMMDNLYASTAEQGTAEQGVALSANVLTILLLPGSRIPEAYANWRQILHAVQGVIAAHPERLLQCVAAIAPSLSLATLREVLGELGWQAGAGTDAETNTALSPTGEEQPTQQSQLPSIFHYVDNPKEAAFSTCPGTVRLVLSTDFAQCAQQADIAIAMTGTATEQFVGLGKPVITMPGQGPQFTQGFALTQTHLLGCSVILVPTPDQVAPALDKVLHNADRLQAIAHNGRQRMGTPGAAARIATQLLTLR